MGIKTNINDANQYQMDPRQQLCWDLYINPKSETFSNGLQSAIKAGYDDEYAQSITSAKWFCGKVRKLGMLDKAEKVLEECLEMETVTDKGIEAQLVKIKQDTAKFIAERVGKETYSNRTEMTGKGGKPIGIKMANINAKDATEEEIDNFLLGELS